jgi:drug/metabolite transporter (DMT)-like permease
MKNLPYILMVLLGGVLYGMMSSFVKLFYTFGYNAAELSFGQALGSAFVLAPTILLIKEKNAVSLDRKGVSLYY